MEAGKQLVAPVKPVSAYQGIPDTCIFQDKLWVMKYNSSPDMIPHGGGLVAVYGKFEHAYGNPRDPALNHGSFIGRIRPDRVPSGK